jgi:hypothetical protein
MDCSATDWLFALTGFFVGIGSMLVAFRVTAFVLSWRFRNLADATKAFLEKLNDSTRK